MKTSLPPKKANQGDWHPADVVAALHKKGITLRDLAKQENVTAPTIIKALRIRILRSERCIAAAIGVPAHVIWPSRYEPDGSRLDLRTVAGRARRVNGKQPAGN